MAGGSALPDKPEADREDTKRMTTAGLPRVERAGNAAEPSADSRTDMVRPGVLRLTLNRPKARDVLRGSPLRAIAGSPERQLHRCPNRPDAW